MKHGLPTFVACIAFSTTLAASAEDNYLVETFQKNTKEMDHPAFTYDYTTLSALGISEGNLTPNEFPKMKKKLRTFIHGYFDIHNGKTGDEIKSFHVAVDPVVSRSFGGEGKGWLLTRVELPKGLRYLDFNKDDSIPAKIARHLAKDGCDPAIFKIDPREFNYMNILQGNFGPRCRKLVIQALNSLGIDAIKYSYSGATLSGCRTYGAKGFDSGALMVIRSDKISDNQIQYFWAGTQNDSPEGKEKRLIEQAFLEQPKTGDYFYDQRLWPELDSTPLPAEYNSWKQEHLINCQQIQPMAKTNQDPTCTAPEGTHLKIPLEAIPAVKILLDHHE